jgi:hypothetical protein
MSAKNNQKGKVLERAVKLIQEAVLKSDPKLKGISFSIETNKTIKVADVRHEIDVFVKTLPNSSYESTWIFECKNWSEPVGKNQVIYLTEKVKVVGATKGFLVAKEFTKDARAQANTDQRLGLITCADDFLSPLSFQLQHSVTEPTSIKVNLRRRGVPLNDIPVNLDWKNEKSYLNKNLVNLESFFNTKVEELIHENHRQNVVRYRFEGTHWGKHEKCIEFTNDELVIGDFDVETATVVVEFTVTIRNQKLISKFELQDQGQIFSFEPFEDDVSGNKWEFDLVRPKSQGGFNLNIEINTSSKTPSHQ